MNATLAADLGRIEQVTGRINLANAIDASGRGGNLFFQTLFDSHPEVVCCPVVQYTYSYVMAEYGDATAMDATESHRFVTQKSYFRLVYNEPVGANRELLIRTGGSTDAPFDRARLRALVDGYFGARKSITRRELIVAPFIAYAIVRDMDLDLLKYVLLCDAISQRKEHVVGGFSGYVVDLMLADFPRAKLFHLIRDPRATFASPRHQFVNSLGNMYAIAPGVYFSRMWALLRRDLHMDNACVYLYWLLYLRQTEVAIRAQVRAHPANFMQVKNEDLNLQFHSTMQRIAAWLGVSILDGWRSADFVPTVYGVPWAGSGAYNSRYQRATTGLLANDPDEVASRVTGPNEYVTRRWRTRLNKREIELIEHLFRRDLEEYGYEIMYDRPRRSDFVSLVRNALLPFEGELPTLKWLQAGVAAGTVETLRRLFYAVFFAPFYVVSRAVLFDLVLRRKLFRP